MTSTPMAPTLSRLNAEWAELTPTPVPPTWSFAGAATTLGDLLASVRTAPDAVLGGLLAALASGDGRAGRVVVQAMLPKLVLMAAKDAAAGLDDYLAALWIRAATYPLERRPRRVAANLALDTLKAVKASQPRRATALPGVPLADALADATRVLDAGVRLGLINARTRHTLEVVYVGGRTSRDAAAALGTSPEAVRWRCSQGVRALRAAADALVDELVAA